MTITCCTECWSRVDEDDAVDVEDDGRRCPECAEDLDL
jgi:DNA-directed RNA polymerase subunit RPC12/RpoP